MQLEEDYLLDMDSLLIEISKEEAVEEAEAVEEEAEAVEEEVEEVDIIVPLLKQLLGFGVKAIQVLIALYSE